MTREFDGVRTAFAASGPGRLLAAITRGTESAWQSSRVRSAIAKPHAMPVRIRFGSIAVAVSAAMQPILISMMPRTIRPAMPAYVFVAVALLAAAVAWRADSIATAWPSSTIARWLRR
jgi:hypothetical protein